MKVRQYLLIVVFLLITSTVFAISPKIESFAVYNYSSNEVVINVEFWEGESERNYRWSQDLNGVRLTITDFMSMINKNILTPYNGSLEIINYYSFGAFETISRIPFMEKMNAIFKKLEIICNDGKRVITLENLGDQILKKMVASGGTFYYLEIFDYDLEGKPASEW